MFEIVRMYCQIYRKSCATLLVHSLPTCDSRDREKFESTPALFTVDRPLLRPRLRYFAFDGVAEVRKIMISTLSRYAVPIINDFDGRDSTQVVLDQLNHDLARISVE